MLVLVLVPVPVVIPKYQSKGIGRTAQLSLGVLETPSDTVSFFCFFFPISGGSGLIERYERQEWVFLIGERREWWVGMGMTTKYQHLVGEKRQGKRKPEGNRQRAERVTNGTSCG